MTVINKDIQDRIEDLTTEKTALENEIQNMKENTNAQQQELLDQITALNTEKSTLATELENARSQQEKIREEKTALENDADELKTIIDGLRQDLQQQILNHEKHMEAVNEKDLENAEKLLEERAKLEDLKKASQEMEAEKMKLENAVAASEEKLKNVEERESELKEQLKSFEARASDDKAVLEKELEEVKERSAEEASYIQVSNIKSLFFYEFSWFAVCTILNPIPGFGF